MMSITEPITEQGKRKVVPLPHYGQWIGAAVVILIAIWLVVQVAQNGQVRWNLVFSRLGAGLIFQGMLVTVVLTIISMILGIIGGIVLAIMRLSNNQFLKTIAGLFIWVFRGTPILVQILLWFNIALFIPKITIGAMSLSTTALIGPFTAAILGLAMNEAAYMAEIVRGGIQAIDKGQVEAAQALGMRQGQIMRRIILPQALRVIIPPMGNELVTLLKETSLVSVIGAGDLLTQAQHIGSTDYSTMEMLICACIWYLILTSIANFFQSIIERKVLHDGSSNSDGLTGRIIKFFTPRRKGAVQA